MLEAKLTKGSIEDDYLARGLQIPEVQKKMQAFPVSHENVLAWALQGCDGPVANTVMSRLEGASRDLAYLETHYPPALELMPLQYRESTKVNLERYLASMEEKYWEDVTTHSMSSWLSSDTAVAAKQTFDEFMHRLNQSD